MTTAEGLRAVGAWADRLEAPGFDFGRWQGGQPLADGSIQMPYFEFSSDALAFLSALGVGEFVSPKVDWTTWASTDEAARLRADPSAVASASAQQLQRLLTMLVRGDRFNEGTLAAAFESGLLARVARQAAVLFESGGS